MHASNSPESAFSRPSRAPSLTDLLPKEIERAISAVAGARPFWGRVVRRWLFERNARSFGEMTELPAGSRSVLSERFRLRRIRCAHSELDEDGTQRLGYLLDDGEWIESVLIPDAERTTLCISTQVGCPVRCVFCASGMAGLRRQLTTGEIVEQVLEARARLGEPSALTNVVFMGIGEPLLNFRNVARALETLNSPHGLAIGARRVTISTVGWPERIDRLAALGRPYNLAISLHAADRELRRRIVPHGGDPPLEELLSAARRYFEATGREVTFEYVLVAGLNDRKEHALALVRLLQDFPGTVNLIPLNPVDALPFKTPSGARHSVFRRILERGGLRVTTRRPRGRGVAAACGQLRLERQRATSPS
ncbi:MAG: 23S rRNA (adenine(2503)-C(2))-methyltransferase RlmN [Planctomycetota bacterium]